MAAPAPASAAPPPPPSHPPSSPPPPASPDTPTGAPFEARPGRERPVGITILAVLYALGGLLALVVGAFAVVSAPLYVSMFQGTDLAPPVAVSSFVVALMGVLLLLFGVLGVAAAYGFWKGLEWGWMVGIALAALGLLLGLLSFPAGILAIIVNALLLWYFTRDGVKAWFGKGPLVRPRPMGA